MEVQMGLKKWQKPKLIILVRGSAEEHVLEMCKAFNQTQAIGVNYTYTPREADCQRPGACDACGTETPS